MDAKEFQNGSLLPNTSEPGDNTRNNTEEMGLTVLAILYSFVILIGIIGNSFVVVIVSRKKAMQTTTNYLLVNLAVADIIMLLWATQSQVFRLTYEHPSGDAGDYLCKFVTGGAMVTLAITVTTFTLALIAIEKHNALVMPMKESIRLTKQNVIWLIAAFWIISLVLSVPTFVKAKYDNKQQHCVDVWDISVAFSIREFVYTNVVLKSVLPYIVILYCYTRIIKELYFSKTICRQQVRENDCKVKRRIAKLLITVTIAFYCCYLPYAVLVMYVAAIDPQNLTSQHEFLVKLQTVARFLLYFESCLNPIIYPFHSTNFRRELKHILSHLNRFFSKGTKGDTCALPIRHLPSGCRGSKGEITVILATVGLRKGLKVKTKLPNSSNKNIFT